MPPTPRSPAEIDDLAAELHYIKSHTLYRVGRRLRDSGWWHRLRSLRGGDRRIVTVDALATRNAAAKGGEAWLLYAAGTAGGRSVPWDFLEHRGNWHAHPASGRPYGKCFVAQSPGVLRVPVEDDPELRFMTHPHSGQVAVSFRGRREVIDLYSATGGEIAVFPARQPMLAAVPSASHASGGPSTGNIATPLARTAAQLDFLRRVAELKPPAIAIHCPRWMGVTHSTRNLFAACYPVPESPAVEPYHWDDATIDAHAETLLETGVRHFIFSGGDEMHFALMRSIRSGQPAARCDLLWHGGFLFFDKDYDWRALRLWMDAARAGDVTLIGVVKKGMEEFFTRVGLRSRVILNYVPGDPSDTPAISEPGLHAGLWMSDQAWKIPHAMLSALAMIPDARLHAAGLSARAREVAEYFRLPIAYFHDGKLPQAELHQQIRRTHLTLYVTFTECCPMLPLESIRHGVPALVGPNSHLFEDEPFLLERLTVSHPERADIIARYIRRAIDERDEITAALRRYIPAYNDRARRSVDEFLAPVE